MINVLILSIFRDSEKYLDRYFKQIQEVFSLIEGKCGAVWLEGDSKDNTYNILENYKQQLEFNNHYVNLIKFDCHGPYWRSVSNPKRWLQLSTCWNKCLDWITPSKYTMCVESDIIYDPKVVPELISNLDEEKHVIYPMLMIYKTNKFYDTWGFSINKKNFENDYPYYNTNETGDLIKLTSGGGMIVSTYGVQKQGRFGSENCIMQYPDNINLYMSTKHKIYHP